MNRVKSILAALMRLLPLRGEEAWVASRSAMAFSAVAILMFYTLLRAQDVTAAAPTGDKIIILIPQFIAEAVRFRAIDESGWDRAGSDEVYAVFSDGTPNDLITKTYEDVDTGETRTFEPQDHCITPRPACDRGVSEVLHFEVAFFEEDYHIPVGLPGGSFCPGVGPDNPHAALHGGKCQIDDLIGRGSVFLTREELLRLLPRVGDSVEQKLILGGPCGYQPPGILCGTGWLTPTGPEYELTYRIRRLPDVDLPLNIKPQ